MDTKMQSLLCLIDSLDINNVICFCNSKQEVNTVTEVFKNNGFPVDFLHGDLDQPTREETMHKFRAGQSKILVTSDLLNRGIDVQQINYVFNFSLPYSREEFIHRVGRSGRYGRKGIVINLVDNEEKNRLNSFAEYHKFSVTPVPANPKEMEED